MGFSKAPTIDGFGSFGKGCHFFFHGSFAILYQKDLTVECFRLKMLSSMEFPAMHPCLCLKNGFYVYLQLLIETELWFFKNILNISYLKPNKGGRSKKLRRLCVAFLKIILHKNTLFKVQIETFLIFFISLSNLFGTDWIFERQHFFIQRYFRITGTKA